MKGECKFKDSQGYCSISNNYAEKCHQDNCIGYDDCDDYEEQEV